MTTHERELTEPVDLCTMDGLHLNSEALGWSRRPLHRANLLGNFGLNKRWDYWAVLAGDVVVSATYADIDHFGIGDVYWANLVTGETGGKSVLVSAGEDVSLPDRPGTAPLRVSHDGLDLRLIDDADGTMIEAEWTESDGRPGRLAVMVEQPEHHDSLNVVIAWSEDLFNFTSKHQARPVRGELAVGDQRWLFGSPSGSEAWGVLDVGRGRWPAKINWNWGGGAGRSGDHVIGLQFGAKWTKGSGFTENGIIVDGRLSKIGAELEWQYDWDHPMQPWRIVDPAGQLDVVLTPRFDKHTQVDVSDDLGCEVHQVFGTYSGRLVTDEGLALTFSSLQGFAEEARQRW